MKRSSKTAFGAPADYDRPTPVQSAAFEEPHAEPLPNKITDRAHPYSDTPVVLPWPKQNAETVLLKVEERKTDDANANRFPSVPRREAVQFKDLASTRPELVVQNCGMLRLPGDMLQVIAQFLISGNESWPRDVTRFSGASQRLLTCLRSVGETEIRAIKYAKSEHRIAAIAKDPTNPFTGYEITEISNNYADVRVSLGGMPLSRLKTVLAALAEASEMKTLLLDAAIRNPPKELFDYLSQLLFDLSDTEESDPQARIALKLAAATYDQLQLTDLLSAMNTHGGFYSLSLHVPLARAAKGFLFLINFLHRNKTVRDFYLDVRTDRRFESYENTDVLTYFHFVGLALQENNTIKNFGLSTNVLPPATVFNRAKSMDVDDCVYHDVSDGNAVPLPEFGDRLRESRSLETLTLRGKLAYPNDYAYIFDGLAANQSIRELNLEKMHFDDADMARLADALNKNTTIASVNFFKVKLDEFDRTLFDRVRKSVTFTIRETGYTEYFLR